MDPLSHILLWTALAGAAIPIGGIIARWEHIQPRWLEDELRHSVIAFGGGVLLAAVALVLVPHGLEDVGTTPALLAFGAGGLAFLVIDRAVVTRAGPRAQLMATLLDFVPEALALGAAFTTKGGMGPLLAMLIALQNLPEGFNSYREMIESRKKPPRKILLGFVALIPLGPLFGWIGYQFLVPHPELVGVIMLFASGGILYLIFQDIAPQSVLERHWAPPLGAVAGFALGMLGEQVTGLAAG